jgi:hypothetical protein
LRYIFGIVLSRAKDNPVDARLAVFQAIERFLLVCFRLGNTACRSAATQFAKSLRKNKKVPPARREILTGGVNVMPLSR